MQKQHKRGQLTDPDGDKTLARIASGGWRGNAGNTLLIEHNHQRQIDWHALGVVTRDTISANYFSLFRLYYSWLMHMPMELVRNDGQVMQALQTLANRAAVETANKLEARYGSLSAVSIGKVQRAIRKSLSQGLEQLGVLIRKNEPDAIPPSASQNIKDSLETNRSSMARSSKQNSIESDKFVTAEETLPSQGTSSLEDDEFQEFIQFYEKWLQSRG